MKNILIFTLTMVLVLSANAQNENTQSNILSEESAQIIKLKKIDNLILEVSDYVKIKGKETLIVNNLTNLVAPGELVFFDLESNTEIHRIELKANGLCEAIDYKSKDSIYVLFGDGRTNSISVERLDYKGNVLSHHSFMDKKVKAKDGEKVSFKKDYFIVSHTVFFENKRKLFFVISSNKNLREYRFLAFDIKTEAIEISEKMIFPEENVNNLAYSNSVYLCVSHHGLPMLRFYNSEEIIEWDYEKNQLLIYNFNIEKLNLKDMYDEKGELSNWYAELFYDSDNQIYISNIYINKKYSILVSDSSFTKVVEMKEPKLGSYLMFLNNNIISCIQLEQKLKIRKWTIKNPQH